MGLGWLPAQPSGRGRRPRHGVPLLPWFPSGIPRRWRRQRGSTSGPCSRAPRRVSIWRPGASASIPPAAWVLATHRGTGCASTLKPPDSAASGYGPRACSPSGASGSQGWWWFPTWPRDASAGLWAGPLTRSGRRGSRRCPDPSRCLDLGGLGLRRLGWSLLKGCSTGLPLSSGAFPPSPPWAPRAWSGWQVACLPSPACSSPSTQTTRAARPPSGLRACLDGGPPRCLA